MPIKTDNVVSLHACRCGQPAQIYTVLQPGVPLDDPLQGAVQLHICPACVERTQKLFSQVRPVFSAMMRADVPEGIADQVMGYLLDLLDPNEETRHMYPLN